MPAKERVSAGFHGTIACDRRYICSLVENGSTVDHLIHLDTLTRLSGHLTSNCVTAVVFRTLVLLSGIY